MKAKPAMLQANWCHPDYVEKWLNDMALGRTLNVCCGLSRVGEVRLDLNINTNRTEPGDLFKLPYTGASFDTVICDPPYSYYNFAKYPFAWILRLSDISKRRMLLCAPAININLNRKKWARSLWYTNGIPCKSHPYGTLFLRLYWCFDRLDHILEEGIK